MNWWIIAAISAQVCWQPVNDTQYYGLGLCQGEAYRICGGPAKCYCIPANNVERYGLGPMCRPGQSAMENVGGTKKHLAVCEFIRQRQ